MKRIWIVLMGMVGMGGSLFSQTRPASYEKFCLDLAKQKGNDGERLHRLFREDWTHRMNEYPEAATYDGYPGHGDAWTDLSLEAIARRKREMRARQQAVRSIQRTRLASVDRLNYDLFQRDTDLAVESERFPDEYLAVTQLSGVQQSMAQVLAAMPLTREGDLQDILARLKAVPVLIDQTLVLLQEGLKKGVTPPRLTLRDVPDQVKAQMEEDPSKSPLLRPFYRLPSHFPRETQEKFQKEGAVTLTQQVVPALRRFHDFLTKTYLPGCREGIAWSQLPDGKAWYAYNIKTTTTTALSPEEIHQIGQSEVKRIRGEMEKLIQQLHYNGSFAKFSEFLRTDPQFYYQTPDELLRGYRDIAKRVDPQLVHLFGKLPRLTYGVQAMPAYAEKSQATAYYEQGSQSGGRPGYFCANTYDLKTRPKWEMEALTLHEAVPGHHLQIALAEELENLPEFRRYTGYTAFIEGWGLYAESLGGELGMYQDSYSRFGQLTYEMWRAVRLVVDTGIHALGWSREQALDFFRQNTAKSEHDMEVETDRYIVWAGQALAYKIGELRIRALRTFAELELGNRFDVRGFHDTVLKEGAVPLDILEQQVKEWVLAQKHPKKPNGNS